MFKNISEKLLSIFSSRNKKQDRVAILNNIEKTFIEADMTLECVKLLIEDINKNWNDDTPIPQIIEESIKKLFVQKPFPIQNGNYIFLGAPGSGKTSFIGKFADYLQKKGLKVLVVSLDNQRPAAKEQLKKVCDNIATDFYSSKDSEINIIQTAHLMKGYDIKLFDTTGSNYNTPEAILQIRKIIEEIKPYGTLLVVNSLAGKQAVASLTNLSQELKANGLVITNCDTDDRGGLSMSISHHTQKPIVFASTGEKVDDIEEFDPDTITKLILGSFNLKKIEDLANKYFNDEYQASFEEDLQQGQLSYSNLLVFFDKSSPMFSKIMKFAGNQDLSTNLHVFESIQVLYNSMTPKERNTPQKLKHSQLLRIARGSGKNVLDVIKVDNAINRIRTIASLLKDPNNMKLLEMSQENMTPDKMQEIMKNLIKKSMRKKL